jgi:hypothetical protein
MRSIHDGVACRMPREGTRQMSGIKPVRHAAPASAPFPPALATGHMHAPQDLFYSNPETRTLCADLARHLGDSHGAAGVLANPVARKWLATPPTAAPRLTARQRRLAICVACDGTPSFLSPCLMLNGRYSLCYGYGPLMPPTHSWWEARSAPPPPSRVVVDLLNCVIVEAKSFPGCGDVLRAFVVGAEPGAVGEWLPFPSSTLLARGYPASPDCLGATSEVTYKRNCAVCLPADKACQCARLSTLQSASLPVSGDSAGAPVPPEWLKFAELYHAQLHGVFLLHEAVSLPSPAAAPSTAAAQEAQQMTFYAPVLVDISVTIADPRLPLQMGTSQPGEDVQPHLLLLPRPEPPPPPPPPPGTF